jgi:hypothetical protein
MKMEVLEDTTSQNMLNWYIDHFKIKSPEELLTAEGHLACLFLHEARRNDSLNICVLPYTVRK